MGVTIEDETCPPALPARIWTDGFATLMEWKHTMRMMSLGGGNCCDSLSGANDALIITGGVTFRMTWSSVPITLAAIPMAVVDRAVGEYRRIYAQVAQDDIKGTPKVQVGAAHRAT